MLLFIQVSLCKSNFIIHYLVYLPLRRSKTRKRAVSATNRSAYQFVTPSMDKGFCPPKRTHPALCFPLINSRLRVRCRCTECAAKRRGSCASSRGGIDLDLVVNPDVFSDEDSPLSPLPSSKLPTKVSVVPTLPMPAGGFCRRSAAAQWALAQEMSRQYACAQDEDDEQSFDFAEHEWPELFPIDLFDGDDDLGFDFELIDGEEEEEEEDADDFILQMLEDDDAFEKLDGDWAEVCERPSTSSNKEADVHAGRLEAMKLDFVKAVCQQRANNLFTRGHQGRAPNATVSVSAAVPDTKAAVAAATAAAAALKLDFKKVMCAASPSMMAHVGASSDANSASCVDDWPTLAGHAASADLFGSSPSSVCDLAKQWVSAVESKTEKAGVPAEDAGKKKSRELHDFCRRTAAQIRRAEKKARERRLLRQPAIDFPPLPL
jgi:hypothetical protein